MNLRVGSVLPPASALAGGLRLGPGQWTRFDYPDSNQVSVAVPVPQAGSRLLSVGISVAAPEVEGNRLEADMVPALQQAAQTIAGVIRVGVV
ncbi:IclR family transcriptional regulator, partial [Achromobacter xylosoxidans]